jgi:undecaprenyl pyrophosphate phosphatase UppP
MIGVAIFFIVLGILIKYGKMYWLIAGYNTMPKEEKEKYNIEGIANLFRNVMFGMALIIISGYLIAKLTENPNIQNYAFWISMIVGIPYLLIASNSNKYKEKIN